MKNKQTEYLKRAKILKKCLNIEKILENIGKYFENMRFLAKYFILTKNGKICEKIFYIFSHIFPIPSDESIAVSTRLFGCAE